MITKRAKVWFPELNENQLNMLKTWLIAAIMESPTKYHARKAIEDMFK